MDNGSFDNEGDEHMNLRGGSTKGASAGLGLEGEEDELNATWVAENAADKIPEELAKEHAPETGPYCI